jgi:hypothetical protein
MVLPASLAAPAGVALVRRSIFLVLRVRRERFLVVQPVALEVLDFSGLDMVGMNYLWSTVAAGVALMVFP